MANGIGHFPPWWHGRFKGCGYRITIARQAILDILSKTNEHLSAEDIFFAVHKEYPNIGLTTVYRTLELLVQLGLVYKYDFGDGKARYELTEGPKGKLHHHHLVCTECGRVIDYSDFIDEEFELLRRTEKGLSKKYDFEIKGHLIQFYGICDLCRKKK
ncbi:MAG: Fur family transcriptional regulator [candidate division WOR-3 bacterium]